MLVMAQRQRHVQVLVRVEAAGIDEVAVAKGSGLAQNTDNFIRTGEYVLVQLAFPDMTWGMVRRMMRASSARDQLSM